jgi:YfiH family protein
MLDRVTATDGVVFYRSPALARVGVRHGFSTRLGGVSGGPFASLNLGNPNGCPVQDDPRNITANYDRLHAAVGCAGRPRAFVHQVHGDAVAVAAAGAAFDCHAKADAVVCTDPGRVAAVRVADCVPVLLATADGRAVAAVHAGWRGVVAGVVPRAIAALRRAAGEAGAQADAPLAAAVGPSIGFDAFEVGPEVAAEFERAFGGEAGRLIKPSPAGGASRGANGSWSGSDVGKALVDLRAAIRLQLLVGGVPAGSIDVSDRCTFRDADELFSHRREHGVTGRMAAIVGPNE